MRWLRRHYRKIGAALGLAAIAWMCWALWRQRATLAPPEAAWGWRLPLALGAYMAAHALCGLTLFWCCRMIGAAAPLRAAVGAYLLSQPLKYFPAGGAVNVASQSWSLAEIPGVGLLRSLLAISLQVLLTVLPALAIYLAARLSGALEREPVPDWLAALALLAGAAVLLPPVWGRMGALLTWAAGRLPAAFGPRLAALTGTDSQPPAADYRRLRYRWLWPALATALGAWALYGAGFLLIASIYVPVGRGHALVLWAALACSWAVSYLAVFVPGGIGVREGVLAYLLGGAVPAGVALVLALASRAAWTAADGANFLATWLWAGRRPPPGRNPPGQTAPDAP